MVSGASDYFHEQEALLQIAQAVAASDPIRSTCQDFDDVPCGWCCHFCNGEVPGRLGDSPFPHEPSCIVMIARELVGQHRQVSMIEKIEKIYRDIDDGHDITVEGSKTRVVVYRSSIILVHPVCTLIICADCGQLKGGYAIQDTHLTLEQYHHITARIQGLHKCVCVRSEEEVSDGNR